MGETANRISFAITAPSCKVNNKHGREGGRSGAIRRSKTISTDEDLKGAEGQELKRDRVSRLPTGRVQKSLSWGLRGVILHKCAH